MNHILSISGGNHKLVIDNIDNDQAKRIQKTLSKFGLSGKVYLVVQKTKHV